MGRALAFVAVTIFATASIAHAPVPSRTLRLQLVGGELSGRLVFHLPAAGAQPYAAAANLGVALAPRALEGLRLEADGAPLQPKVTEVAARRLPDGAVEASFLLGAGKVKRMLRVAVEQGTPLQVTLIAESGVKVSLVEGAGSPVRGGLSLRPRPGLSCLVAMTKNHPNPTPP